MCPISSVHMNLLFRNFSANRITSWVQSTQSTQSYTHSYRCCLSSSLLYLVWYLNTHPHSDGCIRVQYRAQRCFDIQTGKSWEIDPSTFWLVDDRTSPIHVFYLNITPAVKSVCFIHAMITMISLTVLIQNMMGLCVSLLSVHAFKINS